MENLPNIAQRTLARMNQFANATNSLFELLKDRQDIFMLISNLNYEYYKYDPLSRNNYVFSVLQLDMDLILELYTKVAQFHCFTLMHWIEIARQPLSFEDFRMFRRKVFQLCYHHLCLSQQDGSLKIEQFTLQQILQELKIIM